MKTFREFLKEAGAHSFFNDVGSYHFKTKKKKAVSWNPPEVQAKAAKEKKERKMFARGKREINRLKKQGK